MTRIPPWLFRQAKGHSLNAANLLLATRSLPLALNELRWIKEHVDNTTVMRHRSLQLANLCRKRGQGFPLQYILGWQPFGPLDIKCTPGVLIPRPETEAYTYHLANLIKTDQANRTEPLRILDLCSGTGCIPLLLFSLLQRQFPQFTVRGIDISPKAIALAQANLCHNVKSGYLAVPQDTQQISFLCGDLFDDEDMQPLMKQRWDIMTSNPPYISEHVWNSGCGQLGHSVRKYEPALALVPQSDIHVPPGWDHADAFYAQLLNIAVKIRPKLLLLEVGDEQQALRVAGRHFIESSPQTTDVEIWRDWPDLEPSNNESEMLDIRYGAGTGHSVKVRGTGNVRAVIIRYH
jgi:HemK-like putative methylase